MFPWQIESKKFTTGVQSIYVLTYTGGTERKQQNHIYRKIMPPVKPFLIICESEKTLRNFLLFCDYSCQSIYEFHDNLVFSPLHYKW